MLSPLPTSMFVLWSSVATNICVALRQHRTVPIESASTTIKNIAISLWPWSRASVSPESNSFTTGETYDRPFGLSRPRSTPRVALAWIHPFRGEILCYTPARRWRGTTANVPQLSTFLVLCKVCTHFYILYQCHYFYKSRL